MPISASDFYNLNPTPIMKGVVQVITNTSLFMRRMKFIPVAGFSYRYNRQQTLGGITFRNLNAPYVAPADGVGVINPEIEGLSIFGGTVRTDRQLVNQTATDGADVRASKIDAKVRQASLFFDRNVIKGDPGVVGGSFTGLNARLVGRNLLATGANGGPLTVDLVVRLQDQVVGGNESKVLVMNKATRRSLSSLIRQDARGMQFSEASGTQAAKFNGSDVEVVDEDGDEVPILDLNETLGTNSATASMYCCNFGQQADEQNMQGLVGKKMIEHVPYGERDGVYSDLIEGLMGVALFHPRCAARLAGITY